MTEISKMLTLSSAHISQRTRNLLSDAARNLKTATFPIPVYAKDNFGFFIYIPEDIDMYKDSSHMPADMFGLLQYTRDLDCHVLCIDSDGLRIPYLPCYDEWDIQDEVGQNIPVSRTDLPYNLANILILTYGTTCSVSGILRMTDEKIMSDTGLNRSDVIRIRQNFRNPAG